METDFCVAALQEAMEWHGRLDVFNTDQGVQFTSAAIPHRINSPSVLLGDTADQQIVISLHGSTGDGQSAPDIAYREIGEGDGYFVP